MFKKIIIRILFRLLDANLISESNEVADKNIEKWLDRQYREPGFRDYIRKRDISLLKSTGMLLPRDDYAVRCGQRLELMTLLQEVNNTYEKLEKSRKALKEKVEKENNNH